MDNDIENIPQCREYFSESPEAAGLSIEVDEVAICIGVKPVITEMQYRQMQTYYSI